MNKHTLNKYKFMFLIPIAIFVLSCSQGTDTNTTAGDNNQADLVITDIFKKPGKPDAIYVKYKNVGSAAVGESFLIKLSSAKGSFQGNHNYRFEVPEPGTEVTSGAYIIDLLSIANDETAKITAEIDWEQRAPESNEANNSLTKVVYGYN